MQTLTREALLASAGETLPVTDWFTITQSQIDNFADCTHDHQFIHIDAEKAALTPFGSTIAHGFLSLSMLSYFAQSFGLQAEGAVRPFNGSLASWDYLPLQDSALAAAEIYRRLGLSKTPHQSGRSV